MLVAVVAAATVVGPTDCSVVVVMVVTVVVVGPMDCWLVAVETEEAAAEDQVCSLSSHTTCP
eukprot:COSAG05_NODE_4865_length_1343_cov_1.540193_3_plen_62_part_00